MTEIEHRESYFLVRSQSDRFAGPVLGLCSPTRCPVISWCNPFQPQSIRVPHVCGLRINIAISHDVSVFFFSSFEISAGLSRIVDYRESLDAAHAW